MAAAIKSVVLLGADGNLGPSVMKSLVEHGFDVTVLKRKSSKSKTTYPKQALISDAFEVEELVEVFQGKDAVVVTIRASQTELQKRVVDASVRAGIKRLIPADFGSVDSSSPLTQALVPLYRSKTQMREYLQTQTAQHPDFSWTSLVCGHFFDWDCAFLHMWPRERRADILDDGETRWSASTLSQIGEATARVLERPEVTKNRMIYIQSFLVSQNEVIAAFERATTGAEKWSLRKFDSETYRTEEKRKADAGDAEAVENLVWLLGAIDANWESREDFAMRELGLENEDLDAVVKRVVEQLDGNAA